MKIQSFLNSALLIGFLLISLWGCAPVPTREVVQVTPAKEESTPKPSKPTLGKELGSLWREDSAWTEFYTSQQAARTSGEVLFLKISERLKSFLSSKLQKHSSEELQLLLPETASLVTVIKDVLPRKVYVVTGHFKFKARQKEFEATLKGKVKDQDINAEDIVLLDAVLDLDIAIRPSEMRELAREESENNKEEAKLEKSSAELKENG